MLSDDDPRWLTTAPTPDDDRDLVQTVGDEITVTFDRWSAGQLGLTDVLTAIGILAIGAGLAWLISGIMRRSGRRIGGPSGAAIASVGLLLATGVVMLSVALGLEVLGFSLGPILVLILIVVVLLLLARPLLSNLSSGLLLQLRAALEAGDLVLTNDVLGVVQEVNARSVVLETPDGRRVHVPNRDVAEHTITNYTTVGHRRSSFEFTVDHRADIGTTLAAVNAEVAQAMNVLDDPAPEVRLVAVLGRFAVIRVLIWHGAPNHDERQAVDDAVRATLAACLREGIELDGPYLIGPGNEPEASAEGKVDHA